MFIICSEFSRSLGGQFFSIADRHEFRVDTQFMCFVLCLVAFFNFIIFFHIQHPISFQSSRAKHVSVSNFRPKTASCSNNT